MSAQDNGGPAFPVSYSNEVDGPTVMPTKGMTLRDYFAGRLMPAVFAEAMQDAREGSGLFSEPEWRVGIALDAYKMADAMLRVRGES